MKKYIFSCILILISSIAFARSGWIEEQSIVLPQNTVLNYAFKEDGSIKYFIVIEGIIVNITKNSAQKFMRGECKLELVKWRNQVNNTYRYSIREYKNKNKNIDLSKIQFNNG